MSLSPYGPNPQSRFVAIVRRDFVVQTTVTDETCTGSTIRYPQQQSFTKKDSQSILQSGVLALR